MKKVLLLLFVSLFFSCNDNNYPKAENEMVVAQDFLSACLKGDFKQANFYLMQNATNKNELNKLKEAYYKKDADQRVAYRNANIVILNNEAIDSTSKIITYENSTDKIPHKIKAINNAGDWKIDLQYSFSGNL